MMNKTTITSKFCIILFLIDESSGDVTVVFDAAIAEEWPPAAHVLAVLEVDVDDEALFLVVARTIVELALRTSHKTAAPELDALGLTAWVWFEAHTVNCHHWQTVSHSVASHHGGPRLTLALLLLLCIVGGVADGGRVDEDVGSLECHQAGCLWVPLVPADQYAELAHGCLYRMETEVARGEVEFFVIGWVVGDVHLAILAGDGAVLLQDYSRVVVETRGTALEERGDDDHAEVFRQLAVEVGRWTRDGFGEVEVLHVLYLTEVEGVVEFLQYDELCATMGEVDNALGDASLVVGDVRRNMEL